MKRALPGSFILPVLILHAGCDSVEIGRPDEITTPPKLLRIMVQDETRTGGRFIVTDIMSTSPDISCSDTEPCPAELSAFQVPVDCTYPSPTATQGTCFDPLKPANTPPAVGIGIRHGGNQIRLVFNKILDPALNKDPVDAMMEPLAAGKESPALVDATVVVLKDASGAEVDALKYYDPSGNPDRTIDRIRIPFGPAIVIKPNDQLAAGGKYTVTLDPTKIKDKKGQAATEDAFGPIKTSYEFTMEALYNEDPDTGLAAALPAQVDVGNAFQLAMNAAADTVAVVTSSAAKKCECPNASEHCSLGAGGAPACDTGSPALTPVMVEIFNDQGSDPAACGGDPTVLNIARVSAPGTPEAWEAGDYVYDFSALVKSTAGTPLSSDPFGAAFAGTFTATTSDVGVSPDGLLFPEACMSGS
ncbi:MAG: Ig-like domain-containing protein [Myxococcota bacterium]